MLRKLLQNYFKLEILRVETLRMTNLKNQTISTSLRSLRIL